MFSIITLFPEMFTGVLHTSILKRGQESGKLQFEVINLRDFGIGRHKTVDDKPYGGGAGMVLKVDVMHTAIKHVKVKNPDTFIILTDPKGIPFSQKHAEELSHKKHITILSGHYEGHDKRIEKYVDKIISMGDFVLTGGEIPSMAIVDSVSRLVPGVLGKDTSSHNESFSQMNEERILEHDQYTRPEVYDGQKVPKELLSGNPTFVAAKRSESALKNTKKVRPDLLKEV
jgi:tRNA (guanine37-N1)-methyltransferase